jgi:anti-sigma factor RsiW
MEPQFTRQQHHLTDEQFTELLLGTHSPSVRAHLAACRHCSQEAERVSGAIGSFQQKSHLWAEHRAARSRLVRASDCQPVFPWLQRPQAWTAAALAILLGAGIGVSWHADHAKRLPEPVAIATPAAAVSPSTLKADNDLLSAIDGELSAEDSTAAGAYGLNTSARAVRTRSPKRIAN